jgi:hypothetical protein
VYNIRKDYIQKYNKSRELFKKKVYMESILLLESAKNFLIKDSYIHTNLNILGNLMKSFESIYSIIFKFQDIPLQSESLILEKIGKFTKYVQLHSEIKPPKFGEINWPMIEELPFQNRGITDKDAEDIAHCLKKNKILRELIRHE